MTKRYAISFNAKVTPIKPLNDEFTLCKCYIMALEKNRNLSFIGQDAADAALPTLFNIPVIGHLYVDDEGKYHMGGHDMTIVQNSDGQYEFKSICVPYGVVPQQDNIYYEDIQEPNGDTHTYLVADVILWTGRFPELCEAIYNEETYFGQSMEINVHNYAPLDEDKNYTNILSYSYSALCLLGKSDNPEFHTEPCFPMARVDTYEFAAEDENFSSLMSQLKNELTQCFGEKHLGESPQKGGEKMEENIVQTTETTTVEPINAFETTAEITPESENATNEPSVENSENEKFEETHTEDHEEHVEAFSSTYKEKREAIENALPNIYKYDETTGYVYDESNYLCDFDENYAYVERYVYHRDTKSSESTTNEIKGRFPYAFNEATKTAIINGDFEKMYVKWLTSEELAQLETQRTQYEELVAYKAEKTQAEHRAAVDEAIGEFADLEGNEEFAAIVENKYSYESIDSLKNACYIVRGKQAKPVTQQAKFTNEPSVRIGVSAKPDKYEDFFARYGRK